MTGLQIGIQAKIRIITDFPFANAMIELICGERRAPYVKRRLRPADGFPGISVEQ